MDNSSFYTFSEYIKNDDDILTASMQDYLEMIYRLSKDSGFTRTHELSKSLNVQPPSATRMVQKLAELKLLKYKKYGILILEEKGKKIGKKLLERHNIISEFLGIIGTPEDKILQETEKIEHMISWETVGCFKNFIDFIKSNPDIDSKFKSFLKK